MDTNEKTPAREGQEGGKKPYHGKRRPHHHRGNRRQEQREANAATTTSEAKETSKAPSEGAAESTPNQGKGNRQNPRHHRGNGGRADQTAPNAKPRKSEQAFESKTESQIPDTAERRANDPSNSADAGRNERAAQRPQRPKNTNAPKKPAALPQMDNLLIEDCPEENADLSDRIADATEIERILSHDLFAKDKYDVPEVIPAGKVVIIGVRFRAGGKTYFFDPGQLKCSAGHYAVVETARGLEFGEICIGNRMIDESLVVPPLRPVVRLATPADIKQNELNHEREAEAFRIGKEKIAEHGLDMKLVSVQYTFDDSKLLFYFTSDGRVDFRELVKDLAGVFHIRIELRQIGIRDEARMLGGLGACGRPLCCSSFLSDFGQVSMKMAKEQNLSLNSTKISGCCGRLMCCLRYEHETYAQALRQLPSPGAFVNTPDGPGVVTDVLPLEEAVKVSLRGDTGTAPKKYSKQDISLQHRAAPSDIPPAEDTAEPDSDD